MSTAEPTIHTLKVPDAELHYQVSGTGPVLLLIPGGPTPGAAFGPMLPHLTDAYTVVTYDPRGMSRSTLDDPAAEIGIADQTRDAHQLLAAVTSEPAYVFGHSSGAFTGLQLATEHPDQVRALVAFEPPVTDLLPDAAWFQESGARVSETYRREGFEAAMAVFLADAGLDNNDEPPTEPDSEQAEFMAAMAANMEVFIGRVFAQLAGYLPDVDALRAHPGRIVLGGGTTAKGEAAHRATVALAERLGTPVVDFPGDHGGYGAEPELFATVLRRVLAET